MKFNNEWRDKSLWTPGPLTTSRTVKESMLRDFGSRDSGFVSVIKEIRRRLVELGGASTSEYTCIPMQGSGTFSLEAVISSCVPRDGKVLVVVNGAYGARLVKICQVLGVAVQELRYAENELPRADDIAAILAGDKAISHVSMCHWETTSGIFNPIEEIGAVVHAAGRLFYVDAMSSYGAVPCDLKKCAIDYLVSSSNKCIEGVPGFAYVIARLEPFHKTQGLARSLVLDLYDQWQALEKTSQFRFTPPTHAMLAFHQALLELEAEGGVAARAERYAANNRRMIEGMTAMGYKLYLDPKVQGWIISSFHYPQDSAWNFEKFYSGLNDEGYVIYPGKVGSAECFRLGNIGRLSLRDVEDVLGAVARVSRRMGLLTIKA
jgi:2-aminoethylphosphonate-pyruvate transaminase